jgi:hypothetical protein
MRPKSQARRFAAVKRKRRESGVAGHFEESIEAEGCPKGPELDHEV